LANTPPNASPSQVNLDLIKAPEVVRNKPDKLSKEELELEEKELLNTELAQNIKARKRYASAVFILVISWVTLVFALLIFQGFGFRGFHLSDNVLLGAIGSTTADIIGILLIVIRYLFPGKS